MRWRNRLPGLPAPFFDTGRFPSAASVSGASLAVHAPGGFSLMGTELALSGGRRVAGEDYRKIIQEQAVPYSNAKRTMFRKAPLLAGALARLNLAGSKDSRWPAPESLPSGIHGNNAAQAAELAWCLDRAGELMENLMSSGEEALRVPVQPGPGVGTAVIEAPRGLLVHHYVLDDLGRVAAADVVTPTAINQAAMEAQLLADLAELSNREPGDLVGLAERLVRAHDPCISCSVHLLECSSSG